MYQEIDDKVEVTSFLHLSDDAEMHFESGIWKGREQIREKFRAFDAPMDTKHVIEEYYEGDGIMMFRGYMISTPKDTGKTTTAVIAHFFYPDAKDPTKMGRWYAAAGPFDLS